MECVFCRIFSGEAPARVFYKDDDVVVFYDRAPLAPIHLLAVHREHYQDFVSAPLEVHQKLIETVKKLTEQLGDKGKDFRVMVNNGPKSGQTVFHLHYHILAGL
jgi:histidine triad (HIT) family protein